MANPNSLEPQSLFYRSRYLQATYLLTNLLTANSCIQDHQKSDQHCSTKTKVIWFSCGTSLSLSCIDILSSRSPNGAPKGTPNNVAVLNEADCPKELDHATIPSRTGPGETYPGPKSGLQLKEGRTNADRGSGE